MRCSQSWVTVPFSLRNNQCGKRELERGVETSSKGRGVIADGSEQPRIVLRAESCTTKNLNLQVTLGIQYGLFIPPTGTLNLVEKNILIVNV